MYTVLYDLYYLYFLYFCFYLQPCISYQIQFNVYKSIKNDFRDLLIKAINTQNMTNSSG